MPADRRDDEVQPRRRRAERARDRRARARRGRPRARLASLIIASPSTSRPTRSGTCMRLNVAVAAIGSVGATTAPSTNAAGQLEAVDQRVRDDRDAAHRGEHEREHQDRRAAASSALQLARRGVEARRGQQRRQEHEEARRSDRCSIVGRPGTRPPPARPAPARSDTGTCRYARPRTSPAATSRRMNRNSRSPTLPASLRSAVPLLTRRSAPTTTSQGAPTPRTSSSCTATSSAPTAPPSQSILARVRTRLGDELRFVFRHLPLERVHPHARHAAEAAEAAAAQGAFWEIPRRALRRARPARPTATSPPTRAASGSTPTACAAELASDAHAARVASATPTSAARAGLSSTPAFFVNGVRYTDAYDAGSLVGGAARLAPDQRVDLDAAEEHHGGRVQVGDQHDDASPARRRSSCSRRSSRR